MSGRKNFPLSYSRITTFSRLVSLTVRATEGSLWSPSPSPLVHTEASLRSAGHCVPRLTTRRGSLSSLRLALLRGSFQSPLVHTEASLRSAGHCVPRLTTRRGSLSSLRLALLRGSFQSPLVHTEASLRSAGHCVPRLTTRRGSLSSLRLALLRGSFQSPLVHTEASLRSASRHSASPCFTAPYRSPFHIEADSCASLSRPLRLSLSGHQPNYPIRSRTRRS